MSDIYSGRKLAMGALLVVPLLFLWSCMGKAQNEQSSPNIILIVTDDQGWTHTSHRSDPNFSESKSDYYETPRMDELAQSGILFTQGYAPNPICSPSRHSILFGQNAARHIYNKDAEWYKKTSDWLTIPRAIKRANPDYMTAHFGKWHIGMVPRDAGFDYDDGMTSNNGGELFGDSFLNIKEYTKETKKFLVENQISNPTNASSGGKPAGHWDDRNAKDIFGITDRAKDFIRETIAEERPFYLQISHYAAHLSLVSRKETYQYFKNKRPGERHTNPEFAAMLRDLDTGVGMIMDFVREMGIDDKTYLFLVGDNGGRRSLNQIVIIDENKHLIEAYYSTQHNRNLPLRDGKHSFYEGGLRVPFFACGPGIESNRVSETPVTGLDFLPTFVDLSGGTIGAKDVIDGGSMVPLLLDEGTEEIERNSEYLIFHQASHRRPRSAIRKGDFKLIKYWSKESRYENTPKVELFNISQDLAETTDIISKHPEIANDLEEALQLFLTETKAEIGIRDIAGPFYRLVDDLSHK